MIIWAAHNELLAFPIFSSLDFHDLQTVDNSFVRLNEPTFHNIIRGMINFECEIVEVPHLHTSSCVSSNQVVVVLCSCYSREWVYLLMSSIESEDWLSCTWYIVVPETDHLVSWYWYNHFLGIENQDLECCMHYETLNDLHSPLTSIQGCSFHSLKYRKHRIHEDSTWYSQFRSSRLSTIHRDRLCRSTGCLYCRPHTWYHLNVYHQIKQFDKPYPLCSFLGKVLILTTSSSFSSAQMWIFLSQPTAMIWAIFSPSLSGSNAHTTSVISWSTWCPWSSLSNSVKHCPLLKFHIRAVPSLAVVINLRSVESKQPAVIFAFYKPIKLSMIYLTPWESPNLDISLPVSMSHTAMKLPSSPDTTASNSELYIANVTGNSCDVLISSWVLNYFYGRITEIDILTNQRLILREQARMLLVVLSKMSEVKRSSGL